MTTLSDDSLATIAAAAGTPFYVYDAADARARFRELKQHLPEGADVYYSLKANPNTALVRALVAEGAGCEVTSITELETALAAGVDRRRLIVVGPAKGEREIARSLDVGVKAIIAESLSELVEIDRLAAARDMVQPVAIRINPDFQPSAARVVMTGRASQFGIDEAEINEAVALVGRCPNIVLVGLHVYFGSRILDEEAILQNTREVLALARRVRVVVGRQLAFVDVGGGFGVRYFERERDLDPDVLGRGLADAIAEFRREAPLTRVVIELGRYLVARAGLFVTAVRTVKRSKGKLYAICDGGSNCHAAAAGFGSAFRRNFPVRAVGADPLGPTEPYTVTGPLCTPSDTIAEGVPLPADLRPGDLVCFERAGAYGPSASPVHFLGFGHPAEVLVDGDRTAIVRLADTPQDVLSRDTWIEIGDGSVGRAGVSHVA